MKKRYYVKRSVNDPSNSYNVMDGYHYNPIGEIRCIGLDLTHDQAVKYCDMLNQAHESGQHEPTYGEFMDTYY